MPTPASSPVVIEAPADKLRRLQELRRRHRQLRQTRWPTPGHLAAAIDPERATVGVQTAALDIIDQALVDVDAGRATRLIITMPPQTGKSTRITTVGPLWFLARNPDRRIAIASYQQELADDFSRNIRALITGNSGDEGTLDVGLRIAPDNGAVSRWRLSDARGGVRAAGIASGLTGRPVDILIIDDPISNREQADSETYRERVWNFWTSTAAPRAEVVIVVLTRWHEDDLAGRLLAAEDGDTWRVINIPAQADHDPERGQVDALGREPGEWMQSARFPDRDAAGWEALRVSVGTRDFTALYQGRPAPTSGDVWQRQWWARRYEEPPWIVDLSTGQYRMPAGWEVLMSWDMAFKDTKGSDYVVGQVWARRGAEILLLDQVRARLSFTATVTAFEAQARKWPQAKVKLVEDKANGTAVIDTLRKKITGIVPVTPTESKYARASAVSPLIEAGNAQLPAAGVALFDVDAFVEEAAAFPNGAHDDQVDAASQALARFDHRPTARTSMGSPGGARRAAPRMPAVALASPR